MQASARPADCVTSIWAFVLLDSLPVPPMAVRKGPKGGPIVRAHHAGPSRFVRSERESTGSAVRHLHPSKTGARGPSAGRVGMDPDLSGSDPRGRPQQTAGHCRGVWFRFALLQSHPDHGRGRADAMVGPEALTCSFAK
jgi:hypothetical protein